MTDCPPPPPLVLFTSTLVSSPCPVESPCTPVDIDLGYTINVSCFYHLLFLAPFVAGNIKYFKIGGVLQGRNILIFLPYTHLLVIRQIANKYRKDPFKMYLSCMRMWRWVAPRGGNIFQHLREKTNHPS